jgi:ankyrin repeat protein
VQARSLSGHTALLVAARSGKDRVVTLLGTRGADVTAVDANGLSALHHAVIANSRPTAAAVVQLGGATGARDANGKTALEVAALMGRLGVVAGLA